MTRARKLTFPFWARAAVSLALVGLVLSQLHLDVALDRVSGGQWQWFVLGGLCLLGALVVGALRWHRFLDSAGIGTSLARTMRIYAVGAFANSFLPTAFGGDALRAWLAGSPGTRARAAVTVIVDRITMLGCVVTFAWICLAADPGAVPVTLVQALAAVTAAMVIGGLVISVAFHAGARDAPWLSASIRSWASKAASSTRACFRGPTAWQTAVLGVAYEALAVLSVWLVARCLDIDVGFSVLAVAIPVVLVATAVPLSIGGLGVREGSYVLLLHEAGVTTTDAALLSISSTVLFALVTLPGAFVLVTTDRTAHLSEADAAAPRPGRPTEFSVL